MNFYRRRNLVSVAVFVLLAVVLRLCLPYLVKSYLNTKMAHMGDYRGHMADVDLQLWRGAYSIDQFSITKTSGKVPVPLLSVVRMDMALSWHAIFHGMLRGKLKLTQAELNFVEGGASDESQAGKGVDWRQKLKLVAPIELDQVTIVDSTVTFRNFVTSQQVNLKMTDVNGTVTNLSNVDRHRGSRVADMQATAKLLGSAELQTRASFDPLEKSGDFQFELIINKIDLKQVNALARAYTGLDFASGSGDFVMQLDATNGQLDGYAKPLFHNLQIFSWKQDVEVDHKNPLQLAWEAMAQGVASVFKNHAKDQFATKVPISGDIGDKNIGTFPAVINVLRNAFIKAYTPQLENLKPPPAAAKNS